MLLKIECLEMKRKKENLILKQKEQPPPVGFEPQPLSVRPNKRYLIWRGKRFCQNLTFLMAIFNVTLICYKLATLSGFKISSISFNWSWSQVAATCCSMKKTSLKKPILLSEIHPIWILSQYQPTLRSKSDLFLEQKLTNTLFLIKNIHQILV